MEPISGSNVNEYNINIELAQNENQLGLYDAFNYISFGCLSTIITFTGVLISIPSNCVSIFKDIFIDDQKSWKQVKYHLSLDAIVKAFENDQRSMQDIRKTFSENEENPIQQKILSIIDLLLNIENIELDNSRNTYRQFMTLLREALSFNANDIEYTPFLETLCLYRFTEYHPFIFCETLIQEMMKKGITAANPLQKDINQKKLKQKELKSDIPLELKDMPTDISKKESLETLDKIPLSVQFSYITAVPQNEKAPHAHLLNNFVKGACNINFDPQAGNNIPYVLFDFALNNKMIRVIRSGTPTIQRTDYQSCTLDGKACINPEFICFTESCTSNSKHLLYLSLQNNEERSLASEKARNTALIDHHKQFPNTFYLIILAHDSNFYHQKNSPEKMSYENFKEQFITEMHSPSFFFSEQLADFKIFQEIMDEVHTDLYLNSITLTKKERLDFIEFYYARLTLHFLIKSKADYLMNVCKDSIDRAGIRNALLHYLLLIFYQKEKSPVHLNELFIYLHAAPFLIKKRAVNFRQERLLSILQLLESEEIKKRILVRKDELSIQGEDPQIKKIPFSQNIT